MHVHLKDKQKIRARKRWSQVSRHLTTLVISFYSVCVALLCLAFVCQCG